MARIKNFTYALVANVPLRIERNGSIVRCVQASAVFSVNAENMDSIDLQTGIGFKMDAGDSFKSLVLQSAVNQTVQIYIGDGDVQDSRFYGSINALITPGSAVAIPADVVIATATVNNIAANLARRAITVQALSTNTDVLRVGPVAGAAQGVELQPGTSWRFENTAALQVANNTGANQTYITIEET